MICKGPKKLCSGIYSWWLHRCTVGHNKHMRNGSKPLPCCAHAQGQDSQIGRYSCTAFSVYRATSHNSKVKPLGREQSMNTVLLMDASIKQMLYIYIVGVGFTAAHACVPNVQLYTYTAPLNERRLYKNTCNSIPTPRFKEWKPHSERDDYYEQRRNGLSTILSPYFSHQIICMAVLPTTKFQIYLIYNI